MADAAIGDALRDQLRLSPDQSLYGVVDGAQDLELAYEAKCLYGQDIRTLFQGDAAPALADVAPYVVPIDPAGGYLEHWARRWGAAAGVLLTAQGDYSALVRHLREIFVVQDEQGQEYFFRFYDPRVLRVFLPTCTAEEASRLFGPIQRFFVEGDDTGVCLRFSVGDRGASCEQVVLAGQPSRTH